MKTQNKETLQRKIRMAIWITMLGLIVNGVSAFVLRFDLRIAQYFQNLLPEAIISWLNQVDHALTDTESRYSFMLYGYDWLGFAHLLIAIAFIGPLRDPLKNVWVVQFGMIASVLSIIMAMVFERFRHIPIAWSGIDMAIGVVAFLVLFYCNKWINKLKELSQVQ